jgi:prepilin-type N-terminal cleavage/methylation domain-containing protein
MRSTRETAGFSLIELLVVVFIIVIITAVALPKIGRYFRNYQMNSAVREVTGEIQGARNRGVMKNVNFGSVFYLTRSATIPACAATQAPRCYRTALEDDQTPPREPRRLGLDEAEADPSQVTQVRQLPGDVQFGTGCAAGTFAANDVGVRFNRLGAACDPGATSCGGDLVPPNPTPNLVMNDASGSAICLVQPSTGLRRLIRISPGGRVRASEGQG